MSVRVRPSAKAEGYKQAVLVINRYWPYRNLTRCGSILRRAVAQARRCKS